MAFSTSSRSCVVAAGGRQARSLVVGRTPATQHTPCSCSSSSSFAAAPSSSSSARPLVPLQSAANARTAAHALFPSARPSISRAAAAAASAPAASASSAAAAAAPTAASAQILLPADAPGPAGFPAACLPPRDTLPSLPPLDDDYERRVSFAPFANWLVPGALVLGRYPFVEPSRCQARAQGEAQLAALMAPPLRRPGGAAWSSGSGSSGSSGSDGEESNAAAAIDADDYFSRSDAADAAALAAAAVNNGNPGCGVRTFFSLQAELPPQWLMPVGGAAGGFLPYKAAAELIYAGMSGPPPQEALDGLRNPTLDRFLPPRRRAQTPEYEAFARRGAALSFLHCPMEDLGVPAMGQLKLAVAELAGRLAAAEAARRKREQQEGGGGGSGGNTTGGEVDDDGTGAVLLHCWGGRGRAGLVGACLLVAAYGLSADEALLRVQRAFDTRLDGGRLSPETDAQRALVRAFEQEVVVAGAGAV